MPSIRKRLCNKHGVYEGKVCSECKSKRDRSYDNTNRSQASKQFYNSKQWKIVRNKVIANEPLCRICKDSEAKEVDHIVEIKDGGSKLDIDNLQPLCKLCHSKKTAEEVKHRSKCV